MPFRIDFSTAADDELQRLRAFDQRRISSEIRLQLTDSPDVETKNRKWLREEIMADFEYSPPLWELRIGEFRVFYEVNRETTLVYVHAVRRKPPGRTTQEVLNEADGD